MIEHLESVETSIGSRLLNLKRPRFEYSQFLWAERDRIRNQLMLMQVRIEMQRQRLILDYEKEMRNLHDRLVLLLNKHEQLRFDDVDGN